MITVRPAKARGHLDFGWLDTHHSFSFGEYYDPKHMGFRSLRVINDDVIAAGAGFGEHPHRDMEIVTYVLEGAIAHRDSLGNGSTIRPGEVQVMGAGTGIRHSEFNPSQTEGTRLLQIWLLPERAGLPPTYAQKAFPSEERTGRLRPVVSPDGRDGSLPIRQDAVIHAGLLGKGDRASLSLAAGRGAWIQVAAGSLTVNGTPLSAGDGAAVADEARIELVGVDAAEVLVFDLA